MPKKYEKAEKGQGEPNGDLKAFRLEIDCREDTEHPHELSRAVHPVAETAAKLRAHTREQ